MLLQLQADSIISTLIKKFKISKLLIEKVLEQCPSNLVDLGLVVGSRRAWVNTPRRSLHWYRAIKNFIGQSDGLVMNIKATNLGIACNAIHFLDLFAWFTHSSIESLSLSVNSEIIKTQWILGRRYQKRFLATPIPYQYMITRHAILK